MIIIPELETVVILVPRTGTGTLRRAVADAYPKSFMIYRHMEADGVPMGYDRWQRLGVVRRPVDRLWSLYKFLRNFGGDHDPAYIAKLRRSVDRPFSDWIVNNDIPFSTPYDSTGQGRYWPQFTCRHPIPENRKSQAIYLRPDIGTVVFQYDQVERLYGWLGIPCEGRERRHETERSEPPELTPDARRYVQEWFAWDIQMGGGE